MSRNLFGWSLPPGVSTLPGDEDDPPVPGDKRWPVCACGAWLRAEADAIEGAPEHPRCPKHGDNYDRCTEVVRMTDEPPNWEDVPKELWEETRGCLGYFVPTYFYRICRRCGAITREEVL
jgi:hypothetical protein